MGFEGKELDEIVGYAMPEVDKNGDGEITYVNFVVALNES